MRNAPDHTWGLTAILFLILSANFLWAAERVVICENIYSET
jgi:hypothetical protein